MACVSQYGSHIDLSALLGNLGADPERVAIYAGAEEDTRPFVFLHPDFLERQTGTRETAPSAFVYVDRDVPHGIGDACLRSPDAKTGVDCKRVAEHDVLGFPAWSMSTTVTSYAAGDGKHSDLWLEPWTVPLVRIRAKNEDLSTALASTGWIAHLFIGVCDGCTVGSPCQNNLTWPGSMPCCVRTNYWVTDHFRSAVGANARNPSDGDCIQSSDPGLGLRLRQVALLSTKFRNYAWHDGRVPQPENALYGGARLFVVESEWPPLRVWLDDDLEHRRPPDGWVQVTAADEAIRLLATGRVAELSLDHDLGDDAKFGRGVDVVDWLAEQQERLDHLLWPRDGITLHTANAYGRDAMARTIERYASKRLQISRVLTPGGKPCFMFAPADAID